MQSTFYIPSTLALSMFFVLLVHSLAKLSISSTFFISSTLTLSPLAKNRRYLFFYRSLAKLPTFSIPLTIVLFSSPIDILYSVNIRSFSSTISLLMIISHFSSTVGALYLTNN